MESEISIPSRFRGPPESGNGGYVCGICSRPLRGIIEARYRKPAPLDKKLKRIATSAAGAALLDGETLLAEAKSIDRLDLGELPDCPDLETARAATSRYVGFQDHPFPTCFVCGPRRAEGDGLRIFPGQLRERRVLAAPWTPAREFADENGFVVPEILWAALDCPGAYAACIDQPRRVIVLGKMTVRLDSSPRPGEHCIITAWPIKISTSRMIAGTALYSEQGKLHGAAQAVWIALRDRT